MEVANGQGNTSMHLPSTTHRDTACQVSACYYCCSWSHTHLGALVQCDNQGSFLWNLWHLVRDTYCHLDKFFSRFANFWAWLLLARRRDFVQWPSSHRMTDLKVLAWLPSHWHGGFVFLSLWLPEQDSLLCWGSQVLVLGEQAAASKATPQGAISRLCCAGA